MILLATVFMLTAMNASAQSDLKSRWSDTSLSLSFSLTEDQANGSDYSVYDTPILTSANGDTLQLRPTVFRGKRNKRYTERARFYNNALPATTDEVLTGDTVSYDVVINRSEAPWMWMLAVNVDVMREKEGCCNVEDLPDTTLARLVYIPPFVPMVADVEDNTGKAGELQKNNPVLQHISAYRPYDTSRILRKEEGALYVHYQLDKYVLLHDFRDNASTLDRIVDITRQIMADSTSSVKRIQIIGLASVEGPVKRNRLLGAERAAALKKYIQDRVPSDDSLYECVNGGEAWTELRSQIEDGDFPGRDALLEIIDTEPNADRREARIKKLDGGKPYAYLKDNVLRDQRNSGYLRIYYDYVPDTAARTINEASELIRQGRYQEALDKLLTVKGDKRAQNALGVAYCMTGNESEGIACIRRAAADGNKQAQDNLRQYEEIVKKRNMSQQAQ